MLSDGIELFRVGFLFAVECHRLPFPFYKNVTSFELRCPRGLASPSVLFNVAFRCHWRGELPFRSPFKPTKSPTVLPSSMRLFLDLNLLLGVIKKATNVRVDDYPCGPPAH